MKTNLSKPGIEENFLNLVKSTSKKNKNKKTKYKNQ